MGPEVGQLESEVAELCQAKCDRLCQRDRCAVASLKALDLKPGDEVIAPAFTFFATAGALHKQCLRSSWISILTPGTLLPPRSKQPSRPARGIVVVHLFGQMAAMERILPIAKKHDLAASREPRPACAPQDERGVESRLRAGHGGHPFVLPSKNLGAWGDGGMMITQDEALATRLKHLRPGGAWEYHQREVGTNSRLDTLQAAVLKAKLPFLARWSEGRRQRAARYTAAFQGHSATATLHRSRERAFSISTPSRSPIVTNSVPTKEKGIGSKCTIRSVFTCSPASLSRLSAGFPASHRGGNGSSHFTPDLPRADRCSAGRRDQCGPGFLRVSRLQYQE